MTKEIAHVSLVRFVRMNDGQMIAQHAHLDIANAGHPQEKCTVGRAGKAADAEHGDTVELVRNL